MLENSNTCRVRRREKSQKGGGEGAASEVRGKQEEGGSSEATKAFERKGGVHCVQCF